jgi:hypothetical protein
MKNDEMTNEVERLLPGCISDESAALLCDFLAELSMAAESRYFCQIRHYREENRTTVDPDPPWRNHRD